MRVNVILEGKNRDGCKFIIKNGTEFYIDKKIAYSKRNGLLISIISTKTGVKRLVEVSGRCKEFTVKFK